VIDAEKANYPIAMMCRVLKVSRSGYYAWKGRGPSKRQQDDQRLLPIIRDVHAASRGAYGSPRVHRELKEQGEKVGLNRVARLMSENDIQARRPKRYRKTTDSDHHQPVAANVLDRNFRAEAPNQAWVSDITYIRTWQGWLYLAVILDLYSRRVVGWAMEDHIRTELVLKALEMALSHRRPEPGALFHSDRGSQYASDAFQKALEEAGFICSMSRKGNCWDNAVAESFFSTLEMELLDHSVFPTMPRAKTAVFDYIEVFYNRQRRHSYLDYVAPAAFEAEGEAVLVAAS
jgi:transposase InsO family protein